MKSSLDCIPCFLRQALEAARLASSSSAVHEQVLREVLRWTAEMDVERPAPVATQQIHRLIRALTGVADPYRDAKDHQNRMALALLPELQAQIAAAADPLMMAVRGKAVINDATMADARAVGLHDIVDIIDNGSDAPSTLLDDCSQEFRQRFAAADLILAKGQGNFEALSDEPYNLFFLFKAKWFVVADRLGVPVGAHVLARSGAKTAGKGVAS